jgi:N-acyl-phosphatidylethanolamine-hydrolysing phospholipase D
VLVSTFHSGVTLSSAAGRGIYDRFQTLWASWAVEQRPYEASDTPTEDAICKVWFGGDTGLRSVPAGRKQEDMPVCPAFKQIGERFGGFDLAVSCFITRGRRYYLLTSLKLVPIGAYSPRHIFSSVHASPDDAVEIHLSVQSRRSIGMHWGCWALGDEVVMQDPKRLKEACEARGISPGEFDTLYIGETLRQAVRKP